TLKRVDLEVLVAGLSFRQSFPPTPNQGYTFVWDGKDGYGRLLQGRQPVTVRIGYVYPGVYLQAADRPGSDYDSTFGHFSYFGAPASGDRTRSEVTVFRVWQALLGHLDATSQGLGGWTLTPLHTYDPGGKLLYLGDGRTQRAEGIANWVIAGTLGTGAFGSTGDGGPATEATFFDPGGQGGGASRPPVRHAGGGFPQRPARDARRRRPHGRGRRHAGRRRRRWAAGDAGRTWRAARRRGRPGRWPLHRRQREQPGPSG